MEKIESIGIVDDDPITVFGIRKMLDMTVNCDKVESFENGKIALDSILEKLNGNKPLPEVIFLDINMPIMDGWQFLEEFIALAIPEKVRINIVTSSIDPADQENWELYRNRTHHLITFNHKPMRKEKIAEITKVA